MSGRQTLGTKLLPGIGCSLSDATHPTGTQLRLPFAQLQFVSLSLIHTHTHTHLPAQETTLEKQHKQFYKQKLEKKVNSSGSAPPQDRASLLGKGDLHSVVLGDLESLKGITGGTGLHLIVEFNEGNVMAPGHQPHLLEAREPAAKQSEQLRAESESLGILEENGAAESPPL